MKKSILFLVAIFVMGVATAQKGKVTTALTLLDQGNVDKAKEAVDLAMTNEKSKFWPKTYIAAAKVYSKLAKEKKDEKNVIKALDFYKTAIKYDKKGNEKGKQIGKYKKEIGQQLLLFSNELTNAGVEAFNKKDYKAAVAAFKGLLDMNSNDYLVAIQGEKVDTAIIWNTALAAYNDKDWTNAEKYLNQTIELKYGGSDAVLLLDQVFTTTKDNDKKGKNLIRGFELYPNDNRILQPLINYYLTTKQYERAFTYLTKAIEKDPKNASYYYARGVLYDNKKEFDKALSDYDKCLEIDSKYFNALYNKGVIFFNKGVEKINIANEERDFKKYEKKKAEADAIFKKSLPFFEEAHKIKPDEKAVMQSLKNLYYRFEMMDKYKEIDNKLKQ